MTAPPETAPFTRLAEVYDVIMADVEYDDWVAFVLREATRRGFAGGRLLDLGCGTGNATGPALERGFTVDGLDASAAMLAVARRKFPDARFAQGDMRTFHLRPRYGLVYSVFDAVNNLLTPEAFAAMATRVHRHLRPGGVFAFDANTRVGLRELWEDGRVEGWAGDVYYRWTHAFDEASGTASVEAHCALEDDAFTEVHFERPYEADEMKLLLGRAGFASVDVVAYPEAQTAPADEARVWVFARRD